MKNRNVPEHSVAVSVLRKIIKEALCILEELIMVCYHLRYYSRFPLAEMKKTIK
jgi:hypothetical protein